MTKFEKRLKEMYSTGDIHRRFEVVLYDGARTTLIMAPSEFVEFRGCSIELSTNWLDNNPHFISDVKSWRELD